MLVKHAITDMLAKRKWLVTISV